MKKQPSRILLKISASIAAYKSAYLASAFVREGYEVEVAMSKNAERFIGRATFEGLTGRAVFSDVFEPHRMMDHIELSRWADLTLLAPASAHTLNAFAVGLAGDALGSLFLAHDWNKPYLIAPAMNQRMWKHPATQLSLKKLQKWGAWIFEPEHGYLACGEVGVGRLAEEDEILKTVKKFLTAKNMKQKGVQPEGVQKEPREVSHHFGTHPRSN